MQNFLKLRWKYTNQEFTSPLFPFEMLALHYKRFAFGPQGLGFFCFFFLLVFFFFPFRFFFPQIYRTFIQFIKLLLNLFRVEQTAVSP